MHLALSLAALAVAVIFVVGVCRRLDLPAPIVLVAVGAAGSSLPFVPQVHLTAEVVLVGLLPPLLYSAALQTSLVDFNANRRAILLLSIGLVAFTTVGVAVTAYYVLPAISWPAAFALGAVVAPPDAVSATAIARRIGIPRRIVTVLEGESLLNDATALVALRTAIGLGGSVTVLGVGLDFVKAAGGGIVVGLGLYLLVGLVRKHVADAVIDTSLSLVTPFVAYVAAEEIHGSGVLAVVVAGLLLGHRAPVLQTAGSRIAERLNWRTISFLLENSVFLLIGLQARSIIADVEASAVPMLDVVKLCVATFLAVVVLRLVWVFPARFLLVRPGPDPDTGRHPSWQYTAVLGWAGMRGVVTLAAAFAIPGRFAYRETLILTALVVAAGTLFLQGSTLPWLVRRLRLPPPDPREDALARAALFEKASAAGLSRLEEHVGDEDPFDTVGALRTRAAQRNTAAWERLGGTSSDEETPSEAYSRLRLEMLDAEREKVLQVRGTGAIPHEVVEDVLTALDVEESMLDIRTQRRAELEEAGTVKGVAGTISACEHLEGAPRDVESAVEGECEDCVRDGFTSWVHLRKCLTCGHIACCDSSPRRHATAHYEDRQHPVMRSAEPGEEWRWCFVDSRLG
ncbi:MAG: monovalent cation/hydrogen antiporter [Nocardioidaceae bacterium]|nr:monovalent cation/hydrogen antiporter [Nocardioidaceae bacterium]